MRFSHVHLAALAYELPALVVTSDDIERRLAPAYRALNLQAGQLFALTGIRERRWWPPGMSMAAGAAAAARKAMVHAGISADELGMVIYAGVCRDNLEPATACATADALGVTGNAQVYDISNACLGQLNGVIHIAAAIEAGHIAAGIVCSCESSRQIMNLAMERLNAEPSMEAFKFSLATLTGGSGAAAMLLVNDSLAERVSATCAPHRVLGGVVRTRPKWHELCRWGPDTGIPSSAPMVMQTDAPMVLEHGVELGVETYRAFVEELGWRPDKVICHQVGAGHRAGALAAMGLQVEQDFSTFEYLGNIGTVSLPMTAAIASEQGFLQSRDRVTMMGIGSGLNCLMIGVAW